MTRRLLVAASVLGCVAAAADATAAPTPCAELAKLSLPETTITAAEEIPAGEYAPPVGQRQANLPTRTRPRRQDPRQVLLTSRSISRT